MLSSLVVSQLPENLHDPDLLNDPYVDAAWPDIQMSIDAPDLVAPAQLWTPTSPLAMHFYGYQHPMGGVTHSMTYVFVVQYILQIRGFASASANIGG